MLFDKIADKKDEQAHVVTAPQGGKVERLIATDNERVAAGASLVALRRAKGVYEFIPAPHAGRLAFLVSQGDAVGAGQPLARIVPETSVERPTSPVEAIVSDETSNGRNGSHNGSTRPVERPRRGGWEHITLDEIEPPAPATLYEKDEPRQARIVKMMTRPTDEQRDQLANLADALDVPRAELERLAFARLLAMDRTDVVRALSEQRKAEQRGRYGFGARAW